jgi:hypothetical protein
MATGTKKGEDIIVLAFLSGMNFRLISQSFCGIESATAFDFAFERVDRIDRFNKPFF